MHAHQLVELLYNSKRSPPLFFITELEYGNSYEIEYMEKIGSSIIVSFHVHF